jgi:hypothetical protein
MAEMKPIAGARSVAPKADSMRLSIFRPSVTLVSY